jgi:ferric-dicitrate binding protein FerR (iron transport regulator)
MNPSSANNFPWELISGSFTGGLTQEEEFRLQQWLASDPGNTEKYQQLKELWSKGTEDYMLYQKANEAKAWETLYKKLFHQENTKVKYINTNKTRKLFYQVAAACVILLLIGTGYWYFQQRSNTVTYLTAANEQKNIQLTDGTSIALKPATQIKVLPDYNKKSRTVVMTSGEALFTIEHRENSPFIVDLGKVYVQDIGTVFNIKRENLRIIVNVLSGTVTFNKLSTKESREIHAGMSCAFDITNDRFHEIKEEGAPLQVNESELNFHNTPLHDIIAVVQKNFGKTIQLENETIAEKRLTAKLEGTSFQTVLDVICKTLGLEYTVNDSVYILRKKE